MNLAASKNGMNITPKTGRCSATPALLVSLFMSFNVTVEHSNWLFVNLRRTCAAGVITVVSLCVCVSVCYKASYYNISSRTQDKEGTIGFFMMILWILTHRFCYCS